MPHKRNPITAERICGLARVVRAAVVPALENVALWHERDITHSSVERIVFPDAFLALDYMLDRFSWLIEGLVIRPERMVENLRAGGGVLFSQRLLLALVECGMSRDEAYGVVQGVAARAMEEGLEFQALAEIDPAISGRLDPEALASIFDIDAYLRHVDTVFDRLQSLQPKEEPVHA